MTNRKKDSWNKEITCVYKYVIIIHHPLWRSACLLKSGFLKGWRGLLVSPTYQNKNGGPNSPEASDFQPRRRSRTYGLQQFFTYTGLSSNLLTLWPFHYSSPVYCPLLPSYLVLMLWSVMMLPSCSHPQLLCLLLLSLHFMLGKITTFIKSLLELKLNPY